MNTEAALYCDIESPECLKTQAVFPTQPSRGLALRLQSVVYYAMKNDFRGLGLLRGDGTPRPAYLAYQTASSFGESPLSPAGCRLSGRYRRVFLPYFSEHPIRCHLVDERDRDNGPPSSRIVGL